MERKYEPTSPLQSVCFLDFIFIPTFDDSVEIFVHFFFLIFSLYLFQNLVDRKLMNNREAEPVVIGGMVLDINAIPSESAKPRTTTPGKVCWLTFLIL